MATRKEKIDIGNEEQLSTVPAAEGSQDPASRLPPFTVRIYPLSNPKTKLLANQWFAQAPERPASSEPSGDTK